MTRGNFNARNDLIYGCRLIIVPAMKGMGEYCKDALKLAVVKNLGAAYEKFKSGCYAVWYPVKHRAPVRNFFETLRLTAIRDVIAAEFFLREPVNPARLNGCGLLIINPPYGFETQAGPILRAFKNTLGEAGASVAIERLIDE